MEAHQGVRGVIAPAGEELTEHMLQRFLEGENLIFRSHRATERRAKMARARWPDLIEAQERIRAGLDIACLAKVGVVFGDAPEDREHLWYEIDRFEDGIALGTLSSAPMLIPDLKPGDARSFASDEVSDWIVCAHDRRFTPNDAAQLRVYLSQEPVV